jgi:SAM-dependent methyltransferase
MIQRGLLEQLHCPYCDGSFRLENPIPAHGSDVDYGLLRCSCYRYPIVHGVIILHQHGGANISRHLEGGNTEAALRSALYDLVPNNARTRKKQVLDFLSQAGIPAATTFARGDASRTYRSLTQRELSFQEAAELLHPQRYADYLVHRFANPSFLASLALLPALQSINGGSPNRNAEIEEHLAAKRPLLDLGCGCGHSTYVIRLLFPELPVVAADHDFINLYLSRRFLAPEAIPVCIDLEAPLPFDDEAMSGVFCLDAFHYVRSKVALVKELDRAVAPNGIWLFSHLHNALVHNEAAGMPLRPEDYLRCFERSEPKLLVESVLLERLAGGKALDLTDSSSENELNQANALCMVGSRCFDLEHQYLNTLELFLADSRPLHINPIYRISEVAQQIQLQASWPNPRLESECSAIDAYLPEQTCIEQSVWERLRGQALEEKDMSALRDVLRSFVLVPLPDAYLAHGPT